MIQRKLPDGRVITIEDSERTECEIWTRVMGYYRTTRDFNIGKKSEYAERVKFRESIAMSYLEG